MAMKWSGIRAGERHEFICLQIDIEGHNKLVGTDQQLREVKSLFYQHVEGRVGDRGGQVFTWGGDGGAFLFWSKNPDAFPQSVQAALAIVDELSAINDDIRSRTKLTQSLSIRISIDCGMVTYDDNPGLHTGEFLNDFLKNERKIGSTDEAVITWRIHKNIPADLQDRFKEYKESPELGCKLFKAPAKSNSSPPSPGPGGPHSPGPAPEIPPQFPRERAANPYRGLLAFTVNDDDVYFGRGDEARRYAQALADKLCLAICGASGEGKSSLVQAGVLAILMKDPGRWHVLDPVRPRTDPFGKLAESLDEPGLKNSFETEDTPGASFTQRLQALVGAGDPRKIVLFLDQFEEIVTLKDERQRERFLDLVTAPFALATDWARSHYRLILAFRTEFAELARKHERLDELLNTSQLQPLKHLRKTSLSEIIKKPALTQEVKFSEDLLHKLQDDFGQEPIHLPLIQLCLDTLFDQVKPIKGQTLILDDYLKIGDGQGNPGIGRLIDTRLGPMAERPIVRKGLVRQARELLKQLVRLDPSGDRSRDARRPGSISALGRIAALGGESVVKEIVDHLASENVRLIIRDGDTIELAHEVLIREWDFLRDAIDEDREFLLARSKIETAQREGYPLPSSLLDQAAQWSRGDRAQELTSELHAFIDQELTRAAEQQLRGVLDAEPRRLRSLVENLKYRDAVVKRLRAGLADDAVSQLVGDQRVKAHLALAVLGDLSETAALPQALRATTPELFQVAVEVLKPGAMPLPATGWAVWFATEGQPSGCLRAACLLAHWGDRSHAFLDQHAGEIARALVQENRLHWQVWMPCLRGVRPLLSALSDLLRDSDQAENHAAAAEWLVALGGDAPGLLAEVLPDCDPRSYRMLLHAIQQSQASVTAAEILEQVIQLPDDPDLHPEKQLPLYRRQAQAAASLAHLGREQVAWGCLKHGINPNVASYLIRDCARLDVDPHRLAAALLDLDEADLAGDQRYALILALGDYPLERMKDPSLLQKLERRFFAWYAEHPHPGVHGGIEWLLKNPWSSPERQQELARIRDSLKGEPASHRDWYVNSLGQTFVILRPQGAFPLGSRTDEEERYKHEAPHERVFNHAFAVAAYPVTIEEYRASLPKAERSGYEPDVDNGFDPQAPAVSVTWYDAVRYSQWLNEQEGIRPKKPGFTKAKGENWTITKDILAQTGYRLPTEDEWEYAARSGSLSSRHYGDDRRLLRRYAWYYSEEGISKAQPVGRLRPSAWGLFDTLGNAWDWCLDARMSNAGARTSDEGEISNLTITTTLRVVRGGSYDDDARNTRSALRLAIEPGQRSRDDAFRLARTYT